MKIGAVICEFNPFHLGHAYLISEMKKRGAVIAVMSGSFTQRGEPAVVSKYVRARAAVMNGADLVLEIPFPYSTACAQHFACAGVEMICSLGCVQELCFGSETGEVEMLSAAAERVVSPAFLSALNKQLSGGHHISYRHAFSEVYSRLFGCNIFHGSNDILAVLYLSELKKRGSLIEPVAVRRSGEAYDGSGEGYPSASSVRKMLEKGDFSSLSRAVPVGMEKLLKEAAAAGQIADGRALFPLFAALVRSGRKENFQKGPDISEELAARLFRVARQARNMEDFLSLVQTKRYSRSRIRRALLYMLFGVEYADFSGVPYTTVLAANGTGREILAGIRHKAEIDLITKPADYIQFGENTRRAFELAARADSIWELLCTVPREGTAMLKEHPVMI